MSFLSTLDARSPRDTDSVTLGDDAIRQTKEATKSTIRVEHALTGGVHTIPTGNLGTRPPTGHPGRLFMNTQTLRLEQDVGNAWKPISPIVTEQIHVQPVISNVFPAYVVGYGPRTFLPSSGATALLMGTVTVVASTGPHPSTTGVFELVRTPGTNAVIPLQYPRSASVCLLCTGMDSIEIRFYLTPANPGITMSMLFRSALMVF